MLAEVYVSVLYGSSHFLVPHFCLRLRAVAEVEQKLELTFDHGEISSEQILL